MLMATQKPIKKYSETYGSDGEAPALKENAKPDSQTVDDFHTNADTDTRREATHHTLGPGSAQASAGDHNHDGGDSVQLLAGVSLTGSRASDAWRLSIEQALVKLGATTTSTP